jgi:hypothetical protein
MEKEGWGILIVIFLLFIALAVLVVASLDVAVVMVVTTAILLTETFGELNDSRLLTVLALNF